MRFLKRPRVGDVLYGLSDGAHICADCEDGLISVTVDGNKIFEGTYTDSTVVFLSIARVMGKKNVKKLLRLRD
jgi:hypothetical protein